MTNKERKELALNMFLDNRTTYSIHLNTGLPFSEITHYIAQHEEAKSRHKKQLKANREAEVIA